MSYNAYFDVFVLEMNGIISKLSELLEYKHHMIS